MCGGFQDPPGDSSGEPPLQGAQRMPGSPAAIETLRKVWIKLIEAERHSFD